MVKRCSGIISFAVFPRTWITRLEREYRVGISDVARPDGAIRDDIDSVTLRAKHHRRNLPTFVPFEIIFRARDYFAAHTLENIVIRARLRIKEGKCGSRGIDRLVSLDHRRERFLENATNKRA